MFLCVLYSPLLGIIYKLFKQVHCVFFHEGAVGYSADTNLSVGHWTSPLNVQ